MVVEICLVPNDTSSEAEGVDVFSSDESNTEVHGSVQTASPDCIKQTTAILVTHSQCPVQIAHEILLFAGTTILFRCETYQRVYDYDNMNEWYLRLDIPSQKQMMLPTGLSLTNCVRLIVGCASNDQGWASEDRDMNATYHGSWTWSEVTVEKTRLDYLNIAGYDHTDQLAIGVHSKSNSEENQLERDADEIARLKVWPNLRASGVFRHCRKIVQDPTGLVKHIRVDHSVVLVLRSMFSGWQDSAKYGRLEAL